MCFFISIPEHVESAVLTQTFQRFESESEEQMSDDAPSTLKRASTERRSIIQRYRKLMKRESRDLPNNTDENGESRLPWQLLIAQTFHRHGIDADLKYFLFQYYML